MRTLEELTRPNIWQLAPYSSARNEYSGHVAHVFLDANENPYNLTLQPLSRPLAAGTQGKDFEGERDTCQMHFPRQW